MDSGNWIRKLREDRFLRAREIERLSRAIVEATGNPDYYVSHASLADIEAGAVPSIYKLFSLSSLLGISYHDLLHVFGVNPAEAAQFGPPVDPAKTALVPTSLREAGTFPFRLNFTSRPVDPETNLLPTSPEKWPALPHNLFKFDTQRYRYALVGSGDDTMGDLIPPGTLVEVDTQQSIPEKIGWRTLRDRPIYLVWHAHGYTCCWCQQERAELVLVPHPSSEQPVRRFKSPREATVVGRVVAAWVPFVRTEADPSPSLLM